MTVFYLVRHGQIERGQSAQPIDLSNPPLSQQGRAEAQQVAVTLQAHPIARVYSSPLRRAQETAATIAAILGLSVIVDARLRERINYGDVQGQSREDFVALWERTSRERDFVPPMGDSSRGAGERIEAFMAAVYAELPTGEVVAVAHGGAIADFLFNVCSPMELLQISSAFVSQPYAGQIMRNGAITVVDYTRTEQEVGHYVVKAIAMTDHLQAI